MQAIKEISGLIDDELKDAEIYIRNALIHKLENKALADTYLTLSQDRMRGTVILHNIAVKMIADYKEKGGVMPESMQSVYDYLHEMHIDHANRIKMYQSQYSDGK